MNEIIIKAKDLDKNEVFSGGVEYSSPARGKWTIAHLSMLIPHSHQIYIGAICCLRGVVLSAAEFNGLDRYSMIHIKDFDMVDTSMEGFIIDGVTDILSNLKEIPPCVLLYTTCIHHFVACDMNLVFRTLRERFPKVDFVDCYMTPTMRKKVAPDDLMRSQLYAALEVKEKNPKQINIIGNCYAKSHDSELYTLLEKNGYTIKDICTCKTYQEYKSMAESSLNLYMLPQATLAVQKLEKRLNQKSIYIPQVYTFDKIEQNLALLSSSLNLTESLDIESLKQKAKDKIEQTKKILSDVPIAIDYTATNKHVNLARFLLENNFNVFRIYTDVIHPEENDDLNWIKNNYPDLEFSPTIDYRCRFINSLSRKSTDKKIAIGQKAAYFLNTEHFVNLIEDSDLSGFDGICRLCDLLIDAFNNKKDMRNLIQVKAWGCEA